MRTLAVLLAASVWATSAEAGTRRFALVTGSNNGGEERVLLRYANDDAAAFARVMESMGGVEVDDAIVLVDPDRTAMEAALSDLSVRIAEAEAAGDRTELVFYYSGHSDEVGLLPEGEHYGYQDLRDDIDAVPVDLKLVVLDSCASGAMVRLKGGVMRAPFMEDKSIDVEGHVYLTSASENESAQESDKLGGSFFTHYLVAGMRGAADISGDGQVTLDEVYAFARDETMKRTEQTRAGPQHPLQKTHMRGSGALVVTDLRHHETGLLVDQALEGRLFVRDQSDRLVAELHKSGDRGVDLRLDPGDYRIVWLHDDRSRQATFAVHEGEQVRVSNLDFRSFPLELAVLKGSLQALKAPEHTTSEGLTEVPLHVGVIPGIGYGGSGEGTIQKAALSVAWNQAQRVDGAQVAMGANFVSEDLDGVQVSMGINQAGADSHGTQVTMGANVVEGALGGAQVSMGTNIAQELRGFQGTMGLNLAQGVMHGSQVGVGANVATGEVRGMQLAAGANIATGAMKGVQVGSGVNVAEDIEGAQVSFVNVADKASVQVGLVNVARDAEVSFGLVAINAAGYNHLQVFGTDTEPLNLGLTYGGKRLYTVLQGGLRPRTATNDKLGGSALLGLGFHTVPLAQLTDKLLLDLDVSAGSYAADIEGGSDGLLVRGRALFGFAPVKHLGAFAGPTLSHVPYAWGKGKVQRPLLEQRLGEGSTWVGFVAGIRI